MKAITTDSAKGGPMLPDGFPPCEGMEPTMPRAKRARLPKLGRHSSGQARACFDGRMEYFGPFGEPETLARYAERCRQWLAGAPGTRVPHAGQVLTVREMFARYREWILTTGRYTKGGNPTTQRRLIEDALVSFEKFAGKVRVPTLREATLTQWRDQLERDLRVTRRGVNRKVTVLLQALKWGRSRGLLPRETWADVSALRPLQRGECGTRPEHWRPRRAVSLEDVERVAAACSCRHVAGMLRVQAVIGCRPGEVGAMRWSDIDRNGPTIDGMQFWIYRVPADSAKTTHHGRGITYPIPPAAQAILNQFPGVGAVPVFSPRRSMEERGRARKTANPFREAWRTRVYRQAVTRAAKAAGVAYFSPHEVRHGALTRVAELSGVLAAQRLAGHSSVTTTARYLHAPDDIAFRALAAAAKAIC